MRILILGNSYSAKSFFELFKKNPDNIVFSNMKNLENYVEFINIQDIEEFSQANEINLVLILDEDLINMGLQEELSAMNITAFSPSIEAVSIVVSKSSAKKFMHRNKILTPKFIVADKPQIALDYLRNMQAPLAIKPDNHSYIECSQFVETYNQGQKIINKLFETGNKKIVIEDYIEGKNISVWTISDGYSAKIIGTSVKYQNNVALFEPDFIDEELKDNILKSAILPTITSLSAQGEEYVGILGFDFILTRENKFYLLGYNGFFDDIDVDFFTKGFDIDWANVFDSCIVGDVLSKYDFKVKDEYMMTLRQGNEINFISAATKSNLKRYVKELELDDKELKEAEKIWKY